MASLLVGLPHGALDHLLAQTWRSGQTVAEQVNFHLGYLATTAAVVAVWLLAPVAGLFAFLAAAAWHFGESDVLHIPRSERTTPVVMTRGALIVFGPLLVAPEFLEPLLTAQTRIPVPATGSPVWMFALALLHIAALAFAMGWGRRLLLSSVDALALAVLMVGAGPAIGLAVYFIAWHTPDHFDAIRKDVASVAALPALVRAALPRTLVSGAGIAFGALFVDPGDWPRLTVLAIAALTVPHALVVHLTLSKPNLHLEAAPATH